MRYRLLLFAPLLLGGLACSKQNSSPRLDFVGSTRYISSNRTVTRPGDTLTFKIYSSVPNNTDKSLKHVRIFVDYTPAKNPQTYDPNNVPVDPEFTFLDSTMPASAKEFVLQTTFTSRTTSGREQWRFEAEDADGNKTSRGFRLQLHTPDSALLYHRYSAQLQGPGNSNRRSFLALLSGLVLPRYTVRTNLENQNLIDVVYTSDAKGIYLAAPSDPLVTHIKPWGRATKFRSTSLDLAGFSNADTPQELVDAFTGGTAEATHTATLFKGKVFAFYTADNKSGLIYLEDFVPTPIPTLVLQVRITK